jgi:hypothetical protein
MPFGKIKFYAHRLYIGEPIPIFSDNSVNRAITAYCRRIRLSRTRRRFAGPQVGEWR